MNNLDFISRRYLYHYTKFCSGICILNSMTLLYHKLDEMNDINELYRPLYFNNITVENKAKKEMSLFQQISLTEDGKLRGFDIPAMWGHYGDKGNGVCIILDKQKLLSSLPSKDIYKGSIMYVDDYSSDIYISTNNLNDNIFHDDEIFDYFFKKSSDWAYEQEFRILKKVNKNNQMRLDIKDAFVGVIMHHDRKQINKDLSSIGSDNYNLLKTIVGEDKVFVYSMGLGQRTLIDNNLESIWGTMNFNLSDNNIDV